MMVGPDTPDTGKDGRSSYAPAAVVSAYEQNAEEEDRAEKKRSLRTEIPRAFIDKYLTESDSALDAGGGTGVNAILMAGRCGQVTLLDITPGILEIARANIARSGLGDCIEPVEGDITDLSIFADAAFSFVVCVGDSISYVLERRFDAIAELVRVARPGAVLIIGCDSKLGFMRMKLAQGALDEAIEIHQISETTCGMGPRTHLYTVEEMVGLLDGHGCRVLEVASTPTFTDTLDAMLYADEERWEALKRLEL